MEKLDGKSLDLEKTNVETLKQLFPEVVTEGKIDFDKLKIILGEEIETQNEKYEFTWHGKTQAMKMAQTPTTGTLRPNTDSSKNWEDTENLYIEGDNLEVLKLLQKSYFGKIKVIYIDPPYNTGKDFVYSDNFKDNIKNYKEVTKQTAKSNTETNGRYHTDWLNMIYPRLKLARNLLTDDGVIFISIDDNEVENLKKVCNEIYGEDNFIACVVWEKRYTRNNDAKMFSSVIDYLLIYRKSGNLKRLREPRTEKNNSIYKNPDNDPRGRWTSVSFVSQRTKEQRPNLSYKLTNPFNGEKVEHPVNAWKYSYEQYKKLEDDNRLYWGKNGENQYPRLKRFLAELDDGIVPINLWNYKDTGTVDEGTKVVDELIGKDVFDYPKPVTLIKRMLQMAPEKDSIILDFFSGSSTTAHSVMQLNSEDDGNRKFIMVQLPEMIDEKAAAFKNGYKNICEIAQKRISRAGDNIIKDNGKTELDIGYKVFKLDSSNIKPWDPSFEDLEQDLLALENNIKEDRNKDDLLYEVLLKIGLPLITPIQKINSSGKTIYNIAFGSVLVCLENEIDLDIVNEMIKLKPEDFETKVIFKESGFMNDSAKTNAIQSLKKNGISDVRSV